MGSVISRIVFQACKKHMKKGIEDDQGTRNYKEWLKLLSVFGLDKKKTEREYIVAVIFKYLKDYFIEEGQSCSLSFQNNGCKLRKNRFWFNGVFFKKEPNFLTD